MNKSVSGEIAIQILKENELTFEILKESEFTFEILKESKFTFEILKESEFTFEILKESEFTFEILTNCINKSIDTGCFPDSLKEANITRIFKKDDPLDKSNYGPVSILSLISKVYERLIYNQLSEYTERFLSHILCGFRKSQSTQHAFFKLLQSWQKELDNGGFVATILMDLSKAYDCIPHKLLIAKLKCYGIENEGLRLLLGYLTNQKQRTKIGSCFRSW